MELVEIERFFIKVEMTPTGCWLWTAGKSASGYGAFNRREPGSTRQAHRIMYELLVGAIPEGMELDHLCRERACVRPSHLEPVTRRENQIRSPLTFAGQNAAKTHCVNGHPLSGDNLYRCKKGRHCRTCRDVSRRASRARKEKVK